MNATTLQLGPLTLPWSVLALLLGVWLGTWWHERWALRRQLAPGPHGWALPLLALLAARAGFVLAWWPQYAQAPLSLLDVRDGGFQPWAGWAAALGYAGVLALRRSPLRTSVASGVAVAAGWWLAAQLLLWAVAPPPAALPAWQGVALDGRSVAVQQLRGQAVVVNLWASWCPPCHREMPVLLQAQAQQPQVQFLWVNQGEAALKVHTYAQQQGLPAAQVLLDPQSTLGAQLGQRALPTTLFFNARGELVAQRTGELSAATLAQHLALALAP